MSEEYVIVNKSDLVAIADAIRERSNITDGMLISDMESIIDKSHNALIERSITNYYNDHVTSMGDGAFAYCYDLTSISLPAVTTISNAAFVNCTSLTSVNIPSATSIGASAFNGCTSLTHVSLPKVAGNIVNNTFFKCENLVSIDIPLVTNIDGLSAFGYCTSLTRISFPLCTSVMGSNVFNKCSSLVDVNLPSVISIGTNVFGFCPFTRLDLPACQQIKNLAFRDTNLSTLILRNAEQVATLGNTNAFINTPIASGTGYIYVPDELVDGYKAATNWSTYANQIKPLSELEE